jgi:hypothetical protein
MATIVTTGGGTAWNNTTALTFGAATSDLVNCGAAASLNNLLLWTFLAWIYPTTFTNNRWFFQKNAGGNNYRNMGESSATGQTGIGMGTTNSAFPFAQSANSAGNILVLNTWNFIGGSLSADNKLRLYLGNLNTSAYEPSYAFQSTCIPPYGDDSTGDFYLSNRPAADQSFQGRLAVAAYFNRALSLQEIQSWQQLPRVWMGDTQAVGFWRLGKNGVSTQFDESEYGNNGTVTGATVSSGPPMLYYP